MSKRIGGVHFTLGLASAAFSKGIKAAQGGLTSLASGMSRVVTVGNTLTAALAGAGLAALVKHSFESQDALAKTSDRLGTTTEGLKALTVAGNLAGIGQESLVAGLTKYQVTLGKALNGNKQAAEGFKALGLNITELAAMPLDKQFNIVADALNGVENKSQRAAFAVQLFGRSGATLIPLFSEAHGNIERVNDLFEKMGGALNRVDSAKIEAANDSVTILRTSVGLLADKIAAGLSPFIQMAAENMTNFVVSGASGLSELTKTMGPLVSSIGIVADAVQLLRTAWLLLKTTGQAVVAGLVDILYRLAQGLEFVLDKVGALDKGWVTAMDNIRQATADVANESLNELQTALSAPWAHIELEDKVKRFMADAEAAATRVANLASKKNTIAPEVGGLSATEKSINAIIEGLRQQAFEAEFGAHAWILFKLASEGATEAQFKLAESLIGNIENMEAMRKAEKEALKVRKDLVDVDTPALLRGAAETIVAQSRGVAALRNKTEDKNIEATADNTKKTAVVLGDIKKYLTDNVITLMAANL